jgi:hypothetical protein
MSNKPLQLKRDVCLLPAAALNCVRHLQEPPYPLGTFGMHGTHTAGAPLLTRATYKDSTPHSPQLAPSLALPSNSFLLSNLLQSLWRSSCFCALLVAGSYWCQVVSESGSLCVHGHCCRHSSLLISIQAEG